MSRSPYLPILTPRLVGMSSMNFSDSSEMSKPKEGLIRKFGIGKNLRKNLLKEFITIPIVYYLLCSDTNGDSGIGLEQRKKVAIVSTDC